MSRVALLFLSIVLNRPRPTERVAFIYLTSFRYIDTWCFVFIIDMFCDWFSAGEDRCSYCCIKWFKYCGRSCALMCTCGEPVIIWPNIVPLFSTFAEIEWLFVIARGVCWMLWCLFPSLSTRCRCLFGGTNFCLGVVYLIYRLLFETLFIGYQ